MAIPVESHVRECSNLCIESNRESSASEPSPLHSVTYLSSASNGQNDNKRYA
jgi:hypothetical protein